MDPLPVEEALAPPFEPIELTSYRYQLSPLQCARLTKVPFSRRASHNAVIRAVFKQTARVKCSGWMVQKHINSTAVAKKNTGQ